MRDFYKILKLPRTASAAEIKKARRERLRLYHPDINKSPGAEQKAQYINEAADTLLDPRKRAIYDAQLAAAYAGNGAQSGAQGGFQGGAQGAASFEDILRAAQAQAQARARAEAEMRARARPQRSGLSGWLIFLLVLFIGFKFFALLLAVAVAYFPYILAAIIGIYLLKSISGR